MTLNEIDRLIEGRKYQIRVLEDNEKMETVENTYSAEFRGVVPVDLYELPTDLIFWVEGESRAWDFHYKDIIEAKELQK